MKYLENRIAELAEGKKITYRGIDKINKKLRGGQPLRHERTDCNER